MNCDCEECNGTGEVPCENCDGTGQIDCGIESMSIDPTHPKYAELRALRNDAARAEDHAHRLIQMKPEHSESYKKQLAHAHQIIEKQWEKVIRKEESK